jgi:hypothetical protein
MPQYVKTTWVNGSSPAINATNLNKIEDGIFATITQDGSTSMSGQFITIAGSATTPSIAPTGDSNTGVFFSSADTINLSSGGTIILTASTSSVAISTPTVTANGITVATRLKGTASVGTSSFTTSTVTGFTRQANVTVSGVVDADYALVSFITSSYNTASIAGMTLAECYAGGIRLYATATPSTTVTFDYIVIKG